MNQNITVVPIGAITSLTGAWSSGGKAIGIALEMAQNDVNTYLAQKNSTLRANLLVEDSKTDPNEAYSCIRKACKKRGEDCNWTGNEPGRNGCKGFYR